MLQLPAPGQIATLRLEVLKAAETYVVADGATTATWPEGERSGFGRGPISGAFSDEPVSESRKRTLSIGILAYGSLLEEPGEEIAPLVARRIPGVETPFRIEFVRSSPTRGGAPTVVPVESGGASVRGTVLVLHESASVELARDLLWRRETRNVGTGRRYQQPVSPDPNKMLAVELPEFAGVSLVLYARFGPTLSDPTPDELAELAISSAMTEAGERSLDGISYLISLKRQGIATPLMPDYERAVLRKTGASSLEAALAGIRMKAAG